MDATLALALALSGVIGVTLGVFGGGGSILAVPVLVYVARVSPRAAIGMSLAIVGATSLAASYAHHRRGRVNVRVALVFGGAGVATSFLAARLSHLVPERALMAAFAALMLGVGAWMLLGRRSSGARDDAPSRPRLGLAVLAGAGVGAVTGFLGVGGGFLVVPALIAFAGLAMREAVGTSLVVIAINSAAGFLGHLGGDRLDLRLTGALTAAAVAGALAGERLARHLAIASLRRGFAVFVVVIGVGVALASRHG